MARKNEKDHRSKKNPRSAEAYQEERRKRNEARGKQIRGGDKWVRISADSQVRTTS